MTRSFFAFTVGAAAILSIACGESSSSDVGSVEGNATAAPRALAQGRYVLQSDARSGELLIESANASEVRFSVSLVNLSGGHNMGDLESATAKPVNGAWVHDDRANDCRIELKAVDDGIQAAQKGICGFGAGVLADGKYKLEAAGTGATEPEAGSYKIDSNVQGDLLIEAVRGDELTFSLSIVQSQPPHNMGDLEAAKAKRQGSAWVHTGEDCRLELAFQGPTIKVKQEGTCSFGNNVQADGTYAK